MELNFAKYHGAMNDFIVVDNRDKILNEENIRALAGKCQRRSGIGADGVLLLEKEDGYDYRMRIFNPDGEEVSFCGNGARCLYQFAVDEKIIRGNAFFIAGDGAHEASSEGSNVNLRMTFVKEITDFNPVIETGPDAGIYFTGVEHLVLRVKDVDQTDLHSLAAKYRPNGVILPNGLNINIFSTGGGGIKVRTFERGVEGETHACGTGNVAVAYHILKYDSKFEQLHMELATKGGKLDVSFPDGPDGYPWLKGNAVRVYRGTIAF